MSAWEAPARIAARRLANHYSLPDKAEQCVDAVLDTIASPDRDMVAAGLRELGEQMSRGGVCTATVVAVWRAMLARARQ